MKEGYFYSSFVRKSRESKPRGYKTFIDEDRANHMIIKILFR